MMRRHIMSYHDLVRVVANWHIDSPGIGLRSWEGTSDSEKSQVHWTAEVYDWLRSHSSPANFQVIQQPNNFLLKIKCDTMSVMATIFSTENLDRDSSSETIDIFFGYHIADTNMRGFGWLKDVEVSVDSLEIIKAMTENDWKIMTTVA